jgi:beta-glucosidase
MDNWEWAKGYSDRFGVVWTDYNSAEKTRYPKKSAYEMRKIFKHLIAPEKE